MIFYLIGTCESHNCRFSLCNTLGWNFTLRCLTLCGLIPLSLRLILHMIIMGYNTWLQEVEHIILQKMEHIISTWLFAPFFFFTGALWHVLLLCPNSLQLVHLRVCDLFMWLAPAGASSASLLLFFLGLPGILLRGGGSSLWNWSGFQHLWSLIGCIMPP